MFAVIGRVKLKPGREHEALSVLRERGAALLAGMEGSEGGYWARTLEGEQVIQHSFWLFDSEQHARAAETTFNTLRDMPEAPAEFVSVDVCEVVGQAPATS
jgi:heme-degrading monooxygenase HmoA